MTFESKLNYISYWYPRDAAGFSNLGGLAVMWWAKSAPLVVIGLTELKNSGWAKAHPAHPIAAALLSDLMCYTRYVICMLLVKKSEKNRRKTKKTEKREK